MVLNNVRYAELVYMPRYKVSKQEPPLLAITSLAWTFCVILYSVLARCARGDLLSHVQALYLLTVKTISAILDE